MATGTDAIRIAAEPKEPHLPATEDAAPSPPGEESGLPHATTPETGPSPAGLNWPLALGATVIGCFLSFLDISIVNVGLAAMRNQFGGGTTDIEWISTVYSLTIGVVIPASGWLGDKYGLARVYIWSLVGFAAASALCGAAWDLSSMIVFRILQALPGAILPTVTLMLTHRIVPKAKIGIGMAVYGISGVFAPAIGPTLGGYLIEYQNWRLLFYVNIPVCAAAIALAVLFLPRMPTTAAHPFDRWGFASVSLGLFALLLALSKATDWGWISYRILTLLVAAALLLALFIVIELEVDHPLLDPRLFRITTFTGCQILVGILGSGYFAVLFYFPLFLQQGQHVTPVHTGLVMLPEALAMGIGAPLGGLLYDRIGARWPALVGLAIAGVGSYLMCQITWDLTRGDVMWWTAIRGFGYALAIIPVMTAGLAVVPQAHADGANAFSNLIYRVVAALALSALNSIAATQQAHLMASMSPVGDPNRWAHDPAPLIRLYQHLALMVQADTLANLFLIVTVATLTSTVLALLLTHGRPSTPPNLTQDQPS